jgi:hypothetical protein
MSSVFPIGNMRDREHSIIVCEQLNAVDHGGMVAVDGLERFRDSGDLLGIMIPMCSYAGDRELTALIGDVVQALHKHGTLASTTAFSTTTII